MRGYSGSTEREELMKTHARRATIRLLPMAIGRDDARASRSAGARRCRGGGRRVGHARTFDADAAGRPPAGFTFHVVRHRRPRAGSSSASSTNGFLAHAAMPAARPASRWRCSTPTQPPQSVAVGPRSGSPAASAREGIVWRVQDAENYYLARLDLDRQDIGLYRVDGRQPDAHRRRRRPRARPDGVAHAAHRAGRREHPRLSRRHPRAPRARPHLRQSRAARASGAPAMPSRTSTTSGSARHRQTKTRTDDADPRRGR